MKKNTLRLITAALAACAIAVAIVAPARAQTTLTSTTLSQALSGTGRTVNVASATGITVGNLLYIDNELLLVNAINGTAIAVQRGYNGTLAAAHVSGRTVYAGAPNFFTRDARVTVGAACTQSADQLYAPTIQVDAGLLAACVNGLWQGIRNLPTADPTWPRTPVADASYTIQPTDYLVAFTTITGVRTVALPTMTGQPARAFIILDESGGAGSNTISVSGTINGSTSNSITTNYGVLRLWWTGAAWVKW